MKQSFYYAPVVKPIASNGSSRYGFKAYTKLWTENHPERKIEVEISGKTREELQQKIDSFFVESTELPCSYFLCSKAVVDHLKPFEVSKPFESGFEYDKGDENYIAWLHFTELEKYYKEFVEPINEDVTIDTFIEFYANECVPGQMDVSRISLKAAKKEGLFVEISNKIGLTNCNNRAMTIYNLSHERGITPVELINKILK